MALKYGKNSVKLLALRAVSTATATAICPQTSQYSLNRNLSIPKMRFIQFLRKNDFRKRLGVVSQDGLSLVELSGGSCISHDMTEFIRQNISIDEVNRKVEQLPSEEITDMHTLLPPVTVPQKIICIGLNYRDHCQEQKKEEPKEPIFFSKFATALTGPRSNIVAHKVTNKIDWEVELAVVMGRTAKNITKDKAMDYVFGYTIAQDISARDWQRRNGGQFLLGKSMDTFCPMGPSLVHKSVVGNVYDLEMKTSVNGVLKQHSNTGNMIFKIDDIICILSQFMTLHPGDIILTGTPAGVGCYRKPPEFLKAGDIVETEIQCLGKLRNKVVQP